MPNSNSCIRSTTNMGNMSNPSGASFLENAFCRSQLSALGLMLTGRICL
jgi:hypothetical protein